MFVAVIKGHNLLNIVFGFLVGRNLSIFVHSGGAGIVSGKGQRQFVIIPV
jgi:hypothetical protein